LLQTDLAAGLIMSYNLHISAASLETRRNSLQEHAMQTVLRSATGVETIIGPDQPFVIIGERINPTGRKALAAEMLAGNFERVKADALAQVQAGATVLDVNAGLGVANAHELEPEVMVKAIQAVQSVVDVPLCIDSSVPGALIAGMKAAGGRPLINSVTGEDERLEKVLPLIAEHKVAVIAISNDESGISMDPRVRFEVAKRIVQRAEAYGIPREDVLIDPLVMPVGAINTAGRAVLDILRWIHDDLGGNTVCGASNVSFGLPDREAINATFLAMLIAGGMTSAITNPLKPDLKKAVMAADMLVGNDADCLHWLKYQRQLSREAARVAASAPASPSTAAPAASEGTSADSGDREARRAARRAERNGGA
jgi:5-methyltetrahydrofolate--homocysteine methyltransferase